MKQITVKGENIINVPNFISLYRLLVFPVILFMALTGRESGFVILLCISLVSDVLDGNIARLFKLQTNFGAEVGLQLKQPHSITWPIFVLMPWLFWGCLFLNGLKLNLIPGYCSSSLEYLYSVILFRLCGLEKYPDCIFIQLFKPVMCKVYSFLFYSFLVFIPGCYMWLPRGE